MSLPSLKTEEPLLRHHFKSPTATKNEFYFFLVFQNYVTEPLSDRSFKPSFQRHLFILTEIFLIYGPPLLTLNLQRAGSRVR